MGMQRGVPDPYRELGVQRAATAAQIKAAHRKLAKRYHPDADGGDTLRFLSIQEAYALLSDPLRRREWDARHAPGPVRAGDAARRGGGKPRASDGHWTREEGPGGGRSRGAPPAGGRRPAASRPAGESGTAGTGTGRPGGPPAGGEHPGSAGAPGGAAAGDRRENRADPDWNASGRDPSARTYRWSAENVPWWEDFSPRGAAGAAGAAGATPDSKTSGQRPPAGGQPRPPRQTPGGAGAGATGSGAAPAGGATPPAAGQADAAGKPDHGDVYSRSSGAAWSSAARRYFRKGDDDLASRGAFVYRGTQVVTGAKAREASEELLRKRPGVGPSPRQAFEPRPADGPRERQEARSTTSRSSDAAETQPHAQPPLGSAAFGARTERDSEADPENRQATSLTAAATVGALASSIVTVPLLVLGSFVLDPPLQPMFAVILLLIAAITGALAAAVWVRIRPEG